MTPAIVQASSDERRVHVNQGEFVVTDEPGVVLTTILGSCVAACIRDPLARVGGMNHFLLPGEGHYMLEQQAMRYGVYAMELLVNALLQRGAQRSRLEAKLFGGGRVLAGVSDIGERNAAFAERFVRNEGLHLIASSLRGSNGRRVQYWPVTGRARQIALRDAEAAATASSRNAKCIDADGDVDLFL